MRLSVPGPIYNAGAGYGPGDGVAAAPGGQASGAGAAGPPPVTEEVISFPLKDDAIDIWITTLQQRFNQTGRLSDNTNVMSRRDIPQGVTCDVAAIPGVLNGWRLKSSEEWQLLCSMDGFRNVRALRVNGTAARGLTGGGYYSNENPYTVYGEGLWPEQAYDLTRPTQAAPAPTNQNTNPQDGAVGAATPEAPDATASTHEVQRGESLALIAQKYQVSVNSLVEANTQKYPQLTRNPNVIVVGWRLTIPNQ
ncbi:MAG: LysM domain-containing protein [Caldilineaceae bacterium]